MHTSDMRKRNNPSRKNGEMARKLVYFCLLVLAITAVWSMIVTTVAIAKDRIIDLTAVLTFIGASFGGELLLLLVKRVFAKPMENE